MKRIATVVVMLHLGVAALCAQETRQPPKAVGRVKGNSTPENHGSLCDAAASARARNSPAAPDLEAQCKKWEITANERRDLTPGPSGAPVSICDAAQLALDRNASEAADLAAKCRAIGGGQALTSPADQFAAAGQALADEDPLLSELRERQPTGAFQRGFDIGTGASAGQTEWGPGKQRMLDSLKPDEQEGFKIAVSFALDRNRNADFAAAGAAIAAVDPAVAQARQQGQDVRYWLGFDIASGLFGDPALGGEGQTEWGPGKQRILDALSAPAQRGFNASMQFHLSRKYQLTTAR